MKIAQIATALAIIIIIAMLLLPKSKSSTNLKGRKFKIAMPRLDKAIKQAASRKWQQKTDWCKTYEGCPNGKSGGTLRMHNRPKSDSFLKDECCKPEEKPYNLDIQRLKDATSCGSSKCSVHGQYCPSGNKCCVNGLWVRGKCTHKIGNTAAVAAEGPCRNWTECKVDGQYCPPDRSGSSGAGQVCRINSKGPLNQEQHGKFVWHSVDFCPNNVDPMKCPKNKPKFLHNGSGYTVDECCRARPKRGRGFEMKR